ncbi:MAG: hypothetical protein ACWGNB_01425 [Thiogranum sp.]
MSQRIDSAVPALLGLCLSQALAAAPAADDLGAIREEMEALKRAYETRLKALEERLQEAESLAKENRAGLNDVAEAQTAAGGRQARANAFNPAISVVLQGAANSYSQKPDDYALPGFQLSEEAGLPDEGLSLDESELTASANVDHLFYAQSTFSFSDGDVSVEEAYGDPVALPAGFGGRFGRFYSGVGYLNQIHSHAWDFHDAPLAYRAFLGGQYGDDGVRVTWTAPTDLYMMFGAEALAGNNFPGGESQSVSGDVRTLFAKFGGDVGAGWAWQAGISALLANANDRSTENAASGAGTIFNGDSDLYGADMVWKWAPDGNPQIHNLLLRGEVFYRDESGKVNVTDGGNNGLLKYNGDQTGWYAQAVYQFMPQWRFGTRYDRLTSDNHLNVLSLGGYSDADALVRDSGLDDDGHDPHRLSAMLDWSPSEFSRLRLQYDRDNSRLDGTDNQWSLQYIMSIGSHGAHMF